MRERRSLWVQELVCRQKRKTASDEATSMDLLNAIQFDSWAEFVDMGGYAFNVWAVYGLFVAIHRSQHTRAPAETAKRLLRDLRRRARI
jgi:heme exporter protein D